ncbi:MAG: hypothetical protein MUO26_10040 [Methanotrichaceae archaeon]|nr:hypothetical protein [Methanotrichaceae archaeon]
MDPIRGKVAVILNEYAVAINKGYLDGVEEDMRFIIYESGEEIWDPGTMESLGILEKIKAKVKVTSVNEKYSWAETYESDIIPSELLGVFMLPEYLRDKKTRVKLPLGDSPTFGIQYIDRNVKVGDLVRQIVD